jgi:hypothetical protein
MNVHAPVPPAAAELSTRVDNPETASADQRFAAILDRSRQSWSRICAWKDEIIADQAATLAEQARAIESYRKTIRGFELHNEAAR